MKRLLSASLPVTSLALGGVIHTARPPLNASYDVMRDSYKEYNPAFQKYWRTKKGENIIIQMSHGGSSKQTHLAIDDLPADIITMNQTTDIDVLADNDGLVSEGWATRLPNDSALFTLATVFIVRKGNPRAPKGWSDLLRDSVQVVVSNSKTPGNGRYTYPSVWGYVLESGGDENKVREFVGKLFKRAPMLDTGGRAAATTFIQDQTGNVLVIFENEAETIVHEFGRDGSEVVYPSMPAETGPPVAVVDKVVEKRGNHAQAGAYLKHPWSDEGQTIIANNYLHPCNPEILTRFADRFPKVDFFPMERTFGDWRSVRKIRFIDDGIFDQIYSPD